MTQNSIRFLYFADKYMCPVQVFKLYMSKLNNQVDYLWQKPKTGCLFYNDKEWYDARIVSHDPLKCFMKFLSESAKLDKSYMNHSMRVTVIQTLDSAGFEARHIMKLSSHKNESTIKVYATEVSEDKRKEMFDSLSSAISPCKKQKKDPTATVSKNPDTDETLPENFKLVPIDDFDTIDNELLANLIYDTDADHTKTSKKSKQIDMTVVIGQKSKVPKCIKAKPNCQHCQ